MKRNYFLLFFLMTIVSNAQAVDTLVNNPSFTMNHGCAVGSDGTIYSTDVIGNGTFNGDKVYKTLPDGTTTLFASGISGASGLALDTEGNLYVSELNFGRVWKILPDGSASIYATGLGVPAGLAFDSQGNLFVASFQNDLIIKIESNGNPSIFANTPDQPVGIIIDENDNLYVSHEASHVINKITPDGIQTELANIPNTRLQYLTFFGNDILVTGSITDHKIYRVKPDGTYSVFAGSGSQGSSNGNLNMASFDNPTGIGISPDQQTLYIVELNRIRRINNLNLLLVNDTKNKNLKVFPNPVKNIAYIKELDETISKIDIVNTSGQLIKRLTKDLSKIDIGDLESGLYLFKLYGQDSANTTLKIIKS